MADADDRRTTASRREMPPLPADRVEQLRARIESGAYAKSAVLLATARAILESGDL